MSSIYLPTYVALPINANINIRGLSPCKKENMFIFTDRMIGNENKTKIPPWITDQQMKETDGLLGYDYTWKAHRMSSVATWSTSNANVLTRALTFLFISWTITHMNYLVHYIDPFTNKEETIFFNFFGLNLQRG